MILGPPKLLTTDIPVLTADGGRGRLHLALLNPGHWRLLALVVRYGHLPPRDVIVPLKEVAAIADTQVRLWLSRAELEQQPAYRTVAGAERAQGGAGPALVALQYGSGGTSERVLDAASSAALLAGHQASPADGLIALRAGQPVRIGTQRVGRLTRLLLDPERRLRQIVVRTGGLFGREVIVPIDQVTDCDASQIRLGLDRAAFSRLPEYRSDHAVKRDVERALLSDELIRRLDGQTIDVTVNAGVVTLRGHAVAGTSPARAKHAAWGVPGVLEVTDEILTDGKLHLAVVDALERDRRTRGLRLIVYVRRGVVYIHGEAASLAKQAVVEAVVGAVPGVRAVICHSAEEGGVPEDRRALFPRIGQEVYAKQARLGQVEQVIIHPRRRYVTGLVVQERAGARRDAGSAQLEPPQQQERRLVIPMDAVQAVAEGAVLLHGDNNAVKRYADHDLGAYVSPRPGWQPPYPYAQAEVLIERGAPMRQESGSTI